MPSPLLSADRIRNAPADFLASCGEVFAVFGRATQDSGNVSYGVRVCDGGRCFFVKTAGDPGAPLASPAHPDHEGRIALLRNAVALRRSVAHPALPVLHNVIDSPTGPLLVYDWVNGGLLRRRDGSVAFHERFKALPAEAILRALDTIYDVHRLLAKAGWVACDFYDGPLIYDFSRHAVSLVDLDHCHRGPFVNRMGRMFGSTRFMAPEEFELGAPIDERTTVFTLGRTADVFLSDNSLERAPFRGHMPAYRRAPLLLCGFPLSRLSLTRRIGSPTFRPDREEARVCCNRGFSGSGRRSSFSSMT